MNDTVIQVENLGKRYRIGQRERYLALRDVITEAVKAPFRALARRGKNGQDTENFIWALKDVSFEVKRGEVLGIIGRNGAGKSTLLKVLSQITEPTEGRATIHGRVASLLEVGTGFHPELTGRENIFLNGAILGMSRKEIQRKFDEIVAFSEIEKFLDTPVKRYSSGMYVRLAFAVAAHMEPEILLVDEVLAVGDAQFQKKCLGKMGNVAKEGRTVLFVSHNMAAIQSLCQKAFLLDSGHIVMESFAEEVIHRYLDDFTTGIAVSLENRVDREGDGSIILSSIRITGQKSPVIYCGEKLRLQIGYSAAKELGGIRFLARANDRFNRAVFVCDNAMAGFLLDRLPAHGVVTCTTAPLNLVPDVYTVEAAVFAAGRLADYVEQACSFEVQPKDFYGTGKLPTPKEAIYLLEQVWAIERDMNEDEVVS